MDSCNINICKCETLNPLLRDGTSQAQRFLKALDPLYVKVDERKFEDLILFARHFAKYLNYYDKDYSSNSNSDWSNFFSDDICVLISEILKCDHIECSNKMEKFVSGINSNSKLDKEQQVKKYFRRLLRLLYLYFKNFNTWYLKAIDDISLKNDIYLSITSRLSSSLISLASVEKSMYKVPNDWKDNNYKMFYSNWNFAANDIIELTDISGAGHWQNEIQIALSKIETVYDTLLGEYRKIINSGHKYLAEALKKYPAHEPHYSLFIAFVLIFKFAQNHLNKITKRHLDFYYKDILKLNENPAVPDKVHLLFELAKNTSKYSLPAGTDVKAGKDDSGVELIYATDKQLVINKSIIGEIKTLFLDVDESDKDLPVERIYSADAANTADGAGTAFKSDDAKWKTFGCSQLNVDKDDQTMSDATIGFAIASPQFYLAEGERNLSIELNFDSENFDLIKLKSKVNDSSFKFYFSGEKKWIEPTKPTGKSLFDPSENKITFNLLLAAGEPAITTYSSTILGCSFSTQNPVLKIVLTNKPSAYEYLKNLVITSINITCNVKKIKTVLLHNDVAQLNPAKPFMPFGPTPVLGSAFYLGSQEIFNKKLTSLKVDLTWMGLPDNNFAEYYANYETGRTNLSFDFDISILNNTAWENIKSGLDIFSNSNFTKNEYSGQYVISNMSIDRPEEYETVTDYTNLLKFGFIKLELTGQDFQHNKYSQRLTYKIKNDPSNLPNPPYTPMAKDLSVDYVSAQKFEGDVEQFFHIYPFGEVETNPTAIDSIDGTELSSKIIDTASLLPTFTIGENEKQGSLFLGISDFTPPANLSFLFKVAEGSGDTEAEQPELEWYYLSDNSFKTLSGSKIISDTTDSLTTTGIIELDIPSDATKDDTLLTKGKHWVCAMVNQNADKVCELIDINTQAVTATFKDNNNDPEHLAEALTAKSISKLKSRVPEIKSVTQPYASFEGQMKEEAMAFYQRISERLRHKNRAVTIWDYERIVLENFPSIYKVKCINHTNSLSEIAPGSVTIVPISNLRNQNAVDLLKPKTSLNMLLKIEECLLKLVSKHIILEVKNPLYEEVKADFAVAFNKGFDKGYYAEQLNTDIIKHLSPWAYDEGADITFGGKIHASFIINFIEEREYVDYLTDFKMYHIIDGAGEDTPVEVAEVTSSLSILISSDEHKISIIEDKDE